MCANWSEKSCTLLFRKRNIGPTPDFFPEDIYQVSIIDTYHGNEKEEGYKSKKEDGPKEKEEDGEEEKINLFTKKNPQGFFFVSSVLSVLYFLHDTVV